MSPDESLAAGGQGARQLMARLAVVAVQGEQLQALCDELQPLLRDLLREPHLEPAAVILAGTVETVAGVARDIASVTEAVAHALQQGRRSANRAQGPD